MRNPAMADAFYRTQDGARIAFEAKRCIKTEERAKQIATRIRQLKELVYATFVSQVPATCRTPRAILHSIYQDAKPVVRQLGIEGGDDYEKALTAMKYAWSSPDSCREAVQIITKR
jgi:hypothetical protein